MASKKTQQVTSALISAVVYIVLGILFCILKGGVAVVCLYVIGALLIVQGVLDMVNRRLIQGILEAAIGVLVIVFAHPIAQYAVIVFGVLLLVWAVLRLFDNSRKSALALLYIVGAGVVGVLLIINHFAALDWFFLVIGILLIVEGVLCLIPASAKK